MLVVRHRLDFVVEVLVVMLATAEAASHCSLGVGGIVMLLLPMTVKRLLAAMTMGVKQSSVNFRTIHKEVTNIKLSGQIQSISLQSGIFDDIQFRQCRLTRGMKSGASTKAAMSS